MARPYSNDLRERVASAVAGGRSCREVAVLFDVSVVKWSQRQRATGSAASRPMGGHRKRLLEPHRAFVVGRLKAVPDLTLKALVVELAERGIATCPVSVWRLVRSAGMSFKKSLFAEEQVWIGVQKGPLSGVIGVQKGPLISMV